MPLIDWTAAEAEEVRQLMLDRLDRMAERSQEAAALDDTQTVSQYTYFIHELGGILAKLEAAYAND
jgi:hypothetical protein